MADLTLQRGAIPVDLDRPRQIFFDMQATALLLGQYGKRFLLELYTTTGDTKTGDFELHLGSLEALAFFLYAGLQADARAHGETLTLEQAQSFLHSWNWGRPLPPRRLRRGRQPRHPGDAVGKRTGGRRSGKAGRRKARQGRSRRTGADEGFDLDEAQRFAYGVLGWPPARFWAVTVREYHLARQGYELHEKALQRDRKEDVALLLTGLTGERITAAQLLGEEKVDARAKEQAANREHKKVQRKLRRQGIQPGQAVAVQETGEVFQGVL